MSYLLVVVALAIALKLLWPYRKSDYFGPTLPPGIAQCPHCGCDQVRLHADRKRYFCDQCQFSSGDAAEWGVSPPPSV